jgi:hypothetical protein
MISEALKSGDGTLRLVFLMASGVVCSAVLVGVLTAARLAGLF